jgi:hypothetical protein
MKNKLIKYLKFFIVLIAAILMVLFSHWMRYIEWKNFHGENAPRITDLLF